MKCALIMLYLVTLAGCENNHKDDNRLRGDDGELAASEANWTHPQGDLQNTSRVSALRDKMRYKGPQDSAKILWSLPIGGSGSTSAPVIGDDGTIYLVGERPGAPAFFGPGVRDAGVLAVNPDGTQKWFYSYPYDRTGYGWLFRESVAIDRDGTLYLGAWNETLIAINPDGSKKWQYGPVQMVQSAFAIPAIDANGFIYTGRDTVYSFDKTGQVRWRFFPDSTFGICRRIVPGKKALYCIYQAYGVIALSYSGTVKWVYSCEPEDIPHHVLLLDEEDNLYVKLNQDIISLSSSGKLRWSTQNINSPPVLRGDRYFYNRGFSIYTADLGTGSSVELIGSIPRIFDNTAVPVVDDYNNVYSGSYSGLEDNFATIVTGFFYDVHSSGALFTRTLFTITLPNPRIDYQGYMAISPNGTLYFATYTTTDLISTCYLYAIK